MQFRVRYVYDEKMQNVFLSSVVGALPLKGVLEQINAELHDSLEKSLRVLGGILGKEPMLIND